MWHFDGLRVAITAGADGIGLRVAERFLAEDARVAVCDINHQAVAGYAKAHNGMPACVTNVADEIGIGAFFDQITAVFGGLDILINNAGVAGPVASVENMDYAGWKECLDVNLGGMMLASKRAIPMLRASGGGTIINMSSTAGMFGVPNRSPYCVAKWGVIGFTKTLAMELGADNIRANAICPGAVEGNRMERVLQGESNASGKSVEELRRAYVECTSMKTWVSADDLADAILFLCSAHGRRISGQILPVDGHSESIG